MVWSEKERDLSEFILWQFNNEPKYNYSIEQEYVPPHKLDADDSVLTDPTMAARVAPNAYLPSDRREMKVFNNDILIANTYRYAQNVITSTSHPLECFYSTGMNS